MNFPVPKVRDQRRPVILTFTPFYLPGYKAGGPIRSLNNMVTALKDEFDFCIVTSDRDLGDREAYPGIQVNSWHEVAGARVLYLAPGPLQWWRIARLLLAGKWDLIYLNSFFSRAFSMLPTWLAYLGAVGRIPVLIAPRGEFSPGALAIKARRKQWYMALQNRFKTYKHMIWHASSPYEATDIRNALLGKRKVVIAGPLGQIKLFVAIDLPVRSAPQSAASSAAAPPKILGSLKLVFLSRIARMKNLNGALEILAGVRGEVEFNIYGPIEDAALWGECQRLIAALPPNVKAEYRGELAHSQVAGVLRNHHVFFLPTCGENFGHVIVEALSAGCPVLISDQTPWRGLRKKGSAGTFL